MRLFITGATGFIGRHLADRLAASEHDFVCLVRPTSDTRHLEQTRARLVVGDLTDPESLRKGMTGCQGVVHLAAAFTFWNRDRTRFRAVNLKGTRNVMEAALAEGVEKVVHVSTVAVWGNAPWPITEDTPLGDRCEGDYVRTKRLAEELVWELYEERGLPLVVIYPSCVIGPDDPNAAGIFFRRIVHGRLPAQVLSEHDFAWVHVRDVAEATVRALEKAENVGEKYIVSGQNLTFGEISRLVSETSGTPLPRLHMPDWLTVAGATLLTAASRISKRPPPLEMALDQMLLMRQGFRVSGEKAGRELGISYIPTEEGVREEVESAVG